jgi:enterochelin esterase-like enzyme
VAAPSRWARSRAVPGPWWLIALGLLLAAALAVTGLIGLFRYVDTYWLYRGFPPPSVPRVVVVHRHGTVRQVPVVLAQVQQIYVASPDIGGFRDPVFVVLPPGYASHPAERYPVLYLLHGSPGDPLNFLTVGRVQDLESTLVAAGKMKPLILVLPSGGRDFLSDNQWANGASKGNQWESFVAGDLVQVIDSRYRTISKASARGIAGLSEGGYGALNIGLHHPGEFGVLESWSGYMTAENLKSVYRWNRQLAAYNSPADSVQQVASQLLARHTYIWFYCGTDDPLSPQDRAFSAELTGLGIPHRFFEVRGGHSWALWRREMPAALITAAEHLSHA